MDDIIRKADFMHTKKDREAKKFYETIYAWYEVSYHNNIGGF